MRVVLGPLFEEITMKKLLLALLFVGAVGGVASLIAMDDEPKMMDEEDRTSAVMQDDERSMDEEDMAGECGDDELATDDEDGSED